MHYLIVMKKKKLHYSNAPCVSKFLGCVALAVGLLSCIYVLPTMHSIATTDIISNTTYYISSGISTTSPTPTTVITTTTPTTIVTTTSLTPAIVTTTSLTPAIVTTTTSPTTESVMVFSNILIIIGVVLPSAILIIIVLTYILCMKKKPSIKIEDKNIKENVYEENIYEEINDKYIVTINGEIFV